jgi:hypothetical protein
MLLTEVQLETEPRHTGRLVHKNMDFVVCGKNLGMNNLVQMNYHLQYIIIIITVYVLILTTNLYRVGKSKRICGMLDFQLM